MSYRDDSGNNYEIFRECVSGSIVERSEKAKKPAKATKRKKAKKRDGNKLAADTEEVTEQGQDPEELADFIDVPPSLPSRGRLYSYLGANVYICRSRRLVHSFGDILRTA